MTYGKEVGNIIMSFTCEAIMRRIIVYFPISDNVKVFNVVHKCELPYH